jgi:putative PEP-CTERM system TPR-repeat lipoprotein
MGENDKAEAAFKKAVDTKPDNVPAVRTFARFYIKTGKPEEAVTLYDAFLEREPDNQFVLAEAASLQANLNNPDKLEEYLERLVKVAPDKVQPRVYLGLLRLNKGRPAETVALLEEVLQDNQEDLGLLEVLGRAHVSLGDYDAAARYLSRLADISPEASMAHYWYAVALKGQGRLDAADEEIDEALALDGDNVDAKFLKGDIAAIHGNVADLKAALKDLTALDGADSNTAVRDLEASLAFLEGRYDDAIRLNEWLMGVQPSSQRILRLANLESRAGHQERGAARLESWLEEHPKDALVRAQLGSLYSSAGRYADAIQQFETLLDQDVESWLVYNNLAWALYEQGKTDEALKRVNKAVELAPDMPVALDTYGTILLAKGDAKKAIVYLERAVQGEPSATSTQVTLAKAYQAVGRQQEAKETLTRLLRDNDDFLERAEAQRLLENLQTEDE